MPDVEKITRELEVKILDELRRHPAGLTLAKLFPLVNPRLETAVQQPTMAVALDTMRLRGDLIVLGRSTTNRVWSLPLVAEKVTS